MFGNCNNAPPNLYLIMEGERAKIPNMLREDYFPLFIVRSLVELLEPEPSQEASFGDDFMTKLVGNPCGSSSSRNGDDWMDNTLLEDHADFEGTFLLKDGCLNSIGRILKFAKEGTECGLLDKNKFLRHFINEFEYPTLELLYFLDSKFSMASISSYLLRIQSSSRKAKYFQDQFVAFCFSSVVFSNEYRERTTKMLERFLQCILQTFYCNPCSKADLIGVRSMLGMILKRITERLICDNDTQKPQLINHGIVLEMLKSVNIPGTVRSRYFKDQLSEILTTGTSFPSEMDVLQRQEQYASQEKLVALENFTSTISQVLRFITPENVIQLVSDTITCEKFNWEKLLLFTSIWIQERQKTAATLLGDFIKGHLREGLVAQKESVVISSFVLARHCALIAPEVFSRYVNWYTNMFQSETYSPANDSETFTYLTSLLTKWVPLEPYCFLLPHTSYRPFVPNGCREIWNEYVALAKSRIAEYKEVEEAMEFEPNPNDPLQHEVEMAVKAFQNQKKIPKIIYQMVNFQKQHYLNDFLPALLRKPSGVALTDARLRLIEVLRKDGKIPDQLYSKYKLAKGAT